MAVASIEMAALCFDTIYSVLYGSKLAVTAAIPAIKLPIFVTWKKGAQNDLRGCIGTFSDVSLREGLVEYAKISAFNDSRFKPIRKDEISQLQCGVSLLINFEKADNYLDWNVGVHGIRIHFNDGSERSAVFLPEVASEQGWDRVETIDHLIRKSGSSARIDEALRSSLEVVRFQSSKFVLDYEDYVNYKNSRGEAIGK